PAGIGIVDADNGFRPWVPLLKSLSKVEVDVDSPPDDHGETFAWAGEGQVQHVGPPEGPRCNQLHRLVVEQVEARVGDVNELVSGNHTPLPAEKSPQADLADPKCFPGLHADPFEIDDGRFHVAANNEELLAVFSQSSASIEPGLEFPPSKDRAIGHIEMAEFAVIYRINLEVVGPE